jgi:hypothetical protein
VRYRAPVVAFVALMLSTIGCSKDEAKPQPTTTTRYPPVRPVNNKDLTEGQGACRLLNAAEVSAAVGLQATPGTGVETEAGVSSCRWVLRGAGSQFVGVIEASSNVEAYEERVRQVAPTAENLPGVGERALVVTDTTYVFRQGKMLILSVSTTQPVATRKQAATRLTQTAVGRL